MHQLHDIAIIGGGIVGLATAYQLTLRHGIRPIVIEAEHAVARHQTGHNSGVLHSGLYYKPGSAKARNCVEGRAAMVRFCQEQGIRHDVCGKIVVAVDPGELSRLDELERRANANGLVGIRRLTGPQLQEYEPHVRGLGGLFIPQTGIVDYPGVAARFAELTRRAGGVVTLSAQVLRVHRRLDELTLETRQGEIRCRHLINCGGLQADRVARLCGLEPGVQVVPFRGEYYELIPTRQYLVKNLIYPVPDPRFPFLGVHFTRMVNGHIEAGPNAVLAFKREGYTLDSFSLRDCLQMAGFVGFWKLVGKYWRTGLGEWYRSFSKQAFYRALRRLIPELRVEDILPAGAGVRAQAVDATGTLVDDFRFVEADRMIHVLNAPSPAATASLSIGATIADMACRNFSLAHSSRPGEPAPR